MIECTLKEAIELCEKQGGRFADKESHGQDIYEWFDLSDIRDKERYWSVDDIKSEWLYELPKKSAFQEWEEKQQHWFNSYGVRDPALFEKEFLKAVRKEGWNSAIDAVLDLPSGVDKLVDRIKQLKEP